MSHKILLLSQKLERNKKIRYLILFTKLPKEFSNNTSMIQYILFIQSKKFHPSQKIFSIYKIAIFLIESTRTLLKLKKYKKKQTLRFHRLDPIQSITTPFSDFFGRSICANCDLHPRTLVFWLINPRILIASIHRWASWGTFSGRLNSTRIDMARVARLGDDPSIGQHYRCLCII